MSHPQPTPVQMAAYRAHARRRTDQARRRLEERRARAWQIAREAARFLKCEYDVPQVCLFGSLARQEDLSPRSDVDLMVWKLPVQVYYRTVARLQDLEPEIGIDLVMAEQASEKLRQIVREEGIPL